MINNFWSIKEEDLISELDSSANGISSEKARILLDKDGENKISSKSESSAFRTFLSEFKSPIMMILLFATAISFFTKDITDGAIILIIIFISAFISFLQEYKASNTVKNLLKSINVESSVIRDGKAIEVSIKEIVSGDVILLSAGDLIPADCRILESNELSLDESSLTGETFPVEKSKGVISEDTPLNKRSNSLWMGTHVINGDGKAVVVNTAKYSEFGAINKSLLKKEPPNNFELGIRDFGMFLLRITEFIIGIIFLFNIVLHKPVFDSFMFALALAVGLTPQMLPAIISVNLAKGAKKMAEKNVIVKKTSAIENFGSMDVLCSDKTGTITVGSVELYDAFDVNQNSSEVVMLLAFINSSLQTGYNNPTDKAILSKKNIDIEGYKKTGEVPYSFLTKILTITCNTPKDSIFKGEEITVKKGALTEILKTCDCVLNEDMAIEEIDGYLNKINKSYEAFSNDGYRVLGVSFEDHSNREIFAGFLLFLDPIKEGLIDTIGELKNLAVDLKIITGDNMLVARHIALQLKLNAENILTGKDLETLSIEQIAVKSRDVSIFAEINPIQKEKIVLALKADGKVVGYMGDGINDSPAIHAADVGISVNTATDTAKDAASIVLMEQDLEVLIDGIKEGRRTFANTLKYIFIATSANLGNMVSMAGASLYLKFLPLLPKQILCTNLLTDFPSLQIAGDYVSEDWMSKPIRWDMKFIKKFIFTFGLISSVFDFLTFFVLLYIHNADEVIFHTGWFVESIMSATMAMLCIRTRNSVLKSQIGKKLLLSVILVNIFVLVLPFSPLAGIMGLSPLSLTVIMSLVAIVILYLISLEILKKVFYDISHRSKNG